MNLGKVIRDIRHNLNMTTVDIGSKADISGTVVLRIEQSRVMPSINTLEKICKALRVPVWEVIKSAETGESIPETKGIKDLNTMKREWFGNG